MRDTGMNASSKINLLLVVMIISLILSSIIDFFFRIDPYPALNTKVPLPKLAVSLPSIYSFPKLFHDYFNDQFGFRNSLIRLNYILKYNIMNVSPSPKVVVGKEGWLFYTGEKYEEDYCIEDVRGITHFEEDTLRNWAISLKLKKRWLDQQGIKYVLVIPPNKETVYSDYLPDCLTMVKNRTGLDEFVDYMRKNTDIELVDLRPALFEAKKKQQLYYKTDTHWNKYGAFIAYQEMMKPIAQWFPQVTPFIASDFTIKSNPGWPGDLSRLVGGTEFMREVEVDFVPVKPFSTHRDKQSNLLSDPFAPIEMENADNTLPRAVMFRDSFANILIPFLAENFQFMKCYWKGWEAGTPMTKIVMDYEPDIVIEEIVERLIKKRVTNLVNNKPDFALQLYKNMYEDKAAKAVKVDINLLHANEQAILVSTKEGLQVKSTGADPQITLPEIRVGAAQSSEYMIVKLVMSSSTKTMAQLFYLTGAEQTYSENNSVRIDIQKGKNEIYFPIYQTGINGNLRFDPATQPGECIINEISVRSARL